MATNIANTQPTAAGGIRARAAQQSLLRGTDSLNRLVSRLESVAAELASPTKSRTERTILRARFNDLQRKVNELDGIVSVEGLEVRGQGSVTRAADGPTTERTSRAQAPPPAEPERGAPPSSSAPHEGVDVVA